MTGERHRLRLAYAVARPSIERVIEFLKQELDDSEATVAAHVQRHHADPAQALSYLACQAAIRQARAASHRCAGGRGAHNISTASSRFAAISRNRL